MLRLPAPELPPWIAKELPAQRSLIDVGGQRMHVMEQGEGRPVIMMHGNPTWGFLYRRVVTALNGEPLRLIVPDLVGMGLSDKPRDAALHTLDNHARWVGALIDALSLEDFVLVVQDWGGAIGVLGAAQAKGPVAGLVVLNTVLSEPKIGFRETFFHRFSRMPLVSTFAYKVLGFPQRGGIAMAQHDKASVAGDVGRAYRWPFRRFRDRTGPLALAHMVPNNQAHPSIPALKRCREWVEAFDGPAAIVWGDNDPVLGRARNWISKLLPQAAVTQTPAGHFLQEEVPTEIAASIVKVAAAIE